MHSTLVLGSLILRKPEMDMSQSIPMPPPGFDALTVEEQIDYVQSLWDHIAAHPVLPKDDEREAWLNLSATQLQNAYADEEEDYP